MHGPVPLRRAGLCAAAALVLLTGCGGSDKATDASTSTPTSGAAGTSAQAAGSEFCTQAAGVESSVGSAVTDSSDPAAVKEALQAAVAKIRAITPPSEIASDWTALADGVDEVATAFANVDVSNPSAVAGFEQSAGVLEKQLSGPSANVEKYLADKCGLTIPTQSAAPTS